MAPHENRPSSTTDDDDDDQRTTMLSTNGSGGDYVRSKAGSDGGNDGRAATMDDKDENDKNGGTSRFSFEVGYYLTPSACAALRNFTYHGEDQSPIYRHVLSPLAQFLVDNFTPRTVAPNTITTLGMLLMVTSYCLVWYHCPNLVDSNTTERDDFPTWIFLFNGLSMLIYQTLDNMDGKQARATSSSSPLGLLFDHGCDAFNVIIGATNWCAAMGMNPSRDGPICFLATASAMIPFFVVTWEEYHTGELILPPMNGPTEGLILGASLSFTSYALGAGFWHGTEAYDLIFSKVFSLMPEGTLDAARWVFGTPPDDGVYGLRNCDCLMIVTYLTMFREIFSKMHNVMSRNGYRTIRPLRELLPLATFVVAGAGVATSHPELFAEYPRICLNLSAVLFVEMVTQLMLDRMTEQRYRPVRWILFPLVGLWLLPDVLIDALCPLDGVDPRVMYLWTYLVSAAVYVALKVRLVVAEMCCCLEIWCFDIVTPYDPSGKERFRHGHRSVEKVKEN